MKEGAIINRLYVLRCRLAQAGIKERLRRSNGGVPHVLILDSDERPVASVAFFGNGKFYRCFDPWPASQQRKFSSPLPDRIVEHIKEKVLA